MLIDVLYLWLGEQRDPLARELYEIERNVDPDGKMAHVLREEALLKKRRLAILNTWMDRHPGLKMRLLAASQGQEEPPRPNSDEDYLCLAIHRLFHFRVQDNVMASETEFQLLLNDLE